MTGPDPGRPPHPAQRRVEAVLREVIGNGTERGVQVAAYLDGVRVVDAWGGTADAESGAPVTADTLFCVYSATKGVLATLVHQQVDRGRLAYDAPLAEYWPEFGRHGKGGVTLRHALTHSAGIPQLPADVRPEDLCDWEGMCRAVERSAPLWAPGSATGYHVFTFGWILGEVLRRATGRPLEALLREEVCGPLGIDSLYFGVPPREDHRVARVEPSPPHPGAPPPSEELLRAVPVPLWPMEGLFNRPDVRRACVPSAGGYMSARGLARHYAALACGELDGVRLLSEERIDEATEVHFDGPDLVLGGPRRKGLGYFLGGPLDPIGDRPGCFGHPGFGGSYGFADRTHRFALAITKNRMRMTGPGEGTAYLVAREVREALGIPEGGAEPAAEAAIRPASP